MRIKKIKNLTLKDIHEFVRLREKDSQWSIGLAADLRLLLSNEPKHFKNLWFAVNKWKVFDKKCKNYQINIDSGEIIQ